MYGALPANTGSFILPGLSQSTTKSIWRDLKSLWWNPPLEDFNRQEVPNKASFYRRQWWLYSICAARDRTGLTCTGFAIRIKQQAKRELVVCTPQPRQYRKISYNITYLVTANPFLFDLILTDFMYAEPTCCHNILWLAQCMLTIHACFIFTNHAITFLMTCLFPNFQLGACFIV